MTLPSDFLTEAQMGLEDLGLAAGRLRAAEGFEKAITDGETLSTKPAKSLLEAALPAAIEAITARLAEAAGTQARGDAKAVLRSIEPAKLAVIGLNCCLDAALAQHKSLPNVIERTARDVGTEAWANNLHETNPKLYHRITNRQEKAQNTRRRRLKGAQGIGAKEGFEPEQWPAIFKASVAEPILDACLSTGVFELVSEGRREALKVRLTEGSTDALAAAQARMIEWARPVFMPMVVPAGRWVGFKEGGYLSETMRLRTKLVASYDKGRNKLIAGSLARGHMAPIQDALETLSSVPLRLDPVVPEAVRVAKEAGWRAHKLPASVPEPYAFPAGYEALTDEEKKGHRIMALETRKLAQSIATENVVFERTMQTADQLAPYGTFYMPHNLDFRGRCYPMPSFSHHRADWVRGQIRFNNPYPLGEHGEKWLAIHLANNAAGSNYGKLDKLSFTDREAWSHQNAEVIAKVAFQWQEHSHLWAEGVDNPFQFLAACQEWAGCRGSRDNGDEFYSSLPIGLDGTNSGLQHYSAALRSTVEGKLVNLIPGDKPQDVYGVVAVDVLTAIQQDSKEGDDDQRRLADLWLAYGVTRSTVKRQVMTFAYSSETYGFADQIRKDLMQPLWVKVLLGEIQSHPFGDDQGYSAAIYLAKHIWQAIGAIVPSAAAGLAWLKAAAGTLAQHGHPMVWYSPSGMPVLHRYQEWDIQRVNLYLSSGKLNLLPTKAVGGEADDQLKVSMRDRPTHKLDTNKQRSASAPNVVHSLDAAHLTLTVNAAAKEGINDLLMIHDSFATQAGRTEDLARILRSTFVDMYENYCPFEEITRQSRKVLPEDIELPPVPTKGDLDLKQVLRSPYFFG